MKLLIYYDKALCSISVDKRKRVIAFLSLTYSCWPEKKLGRPKYYVYVFGDR
jgi:hypothetical protein